MRSSILAVAGLLISTTALAAPSSSRIPLPDGFMPEGIESGAGNTLYVANFNDGSVLKVDARTGATTVLVPVLGGRQGLGIKLDDHGHLFVAGGATGHAYVYDAKTGASLADYTLATGATFINDLVITKDAVYFTDSFNAVLYKLPLPKKGLPAAGSSVAIPLGGDFVNVPGQFNANGIVADGCSLIVVNSFTGTLFKVDPATGFAKAIDLGGANVVNSDGLILRGKKLYNVENFSNQVVVVKLNGDDTSGTIIKTITSPDFDIIATGVLLGDDVIVTNPRFTTPNTPTTPYWLTRVKAN
jgi:outer membrane protein assembly factor BamB